MIKLLKQLCRRHKFGRIVEISYDGDTIYDCAHCGKRVRKAL